MKMTRRKLALALAAPAVARASTDEQTPASGDLLKAAQDHVTENSKILVLETVPITTEPAFEFKA